MALPLNEAIRDVLAELSEADQEASNRAVAVEVKRKHPASVAVLGDQLAMDALVARIRQMRKRTPVLRGPTDAQLTLPALAKDLLPRIPAQIARYPEELPPVVDQVPEGKGELYEQRADSRFQLRDDLIADEIPWGNTWTSTIAQGRRYAAKLQAGWEDDRLRWLAFTDLLKLAASGTQDADETILAGVQKAEKATLV